MCFLCGVADQLEEEGTDWLIPSFKMSLLILVLHELIHAAVLVAFLRPLHEIQILFLGLKLKGGIRIDFFSHPLGYVSTSISDISPLLAILFFLAPTLFTCFIPIRFAFNRKLDTGVLFLFWYVLGLQDFFKLVRLFLPPGEVWYYLNFVELAILVSIYAIPLIFAVASSIFYFLLFVEYPTHSNNIKNGY